MSYSKQNKKKKAYSDFSPNCLPPCFCVGDKQQPVAGYISKTTAHFSNLFP